MMDLIPLINGDSPIEEINIVSGHLLREFFTFFANNEIYYGDAINFFSLFSQKIKQQRFHPIKAFLFYFAYQTKNYSSPLVKELLGQNILSALIIDNKTYLDFCLYCFYRGIYSLEQKDYYMTTYYYCSAIESGFKKNMNDIKFINGFTSQMLRSLCFLRYLTNFNIKSALNKDNRFNKVDNINLIDHQDIAFCFEFLNKDKNDLKIFNEFVKEEQENIIKCSLQGLYTAAREELIIKIIKDMLKMYKKIKMTKIAEKQKLEVNEIMKVLKKKVLEGEINIKYDEAEDIIEVFDVDPGLKEKVKKTNDLYQKIIEGNKNMFMELKTKKMDQMSGKLSDRDPAQLIMYEGYDLEIPDERMMEEDDIMN